VAGISTPEKLTYKSLTAKEAKNYRKASNANPKTLCALCGISLRPLRFKIFDKSLNRKEREGIAKSAKKTVNNVGTTQVTTVSRLPTTDD
jgi:hypothetical protein